MKKRLSVIALTLLMLLSLTACGGSSASGGAKAQSSYAADNAASYGGYWSEAEAVEAPMETAGSAKPSNGGDSRSNLPEGVKMIYRANLELETTEYEKAQSDIETLTNQLGGYFENQSSNSYSSNYRSASYTVRLPAAQFDAFLRQIGNLCSVRYQNQSAEDVSEYYYDMESRLETAKIKLDRLQELLARAETMEDIITVESAISDVEYQIESLSGELRHYDALIDYSTIYVTLNEVYKVTEVETAPMTFSQRIGSAFREGLRDFEDSLEDFAEWLAYSWLGILVFLAVVAVVVKVIRRVVFKIPFRKKKKGAEPEQQPDNTQQQ